MTRDLPGRVEVAVVGAGLPGLALTLELARRGVATALLERGRVAGPGPPEASGLVNAQARLAIAPEPLRDLTLLSRHLYGDWAASIEEDSGVSCELDTRGGLAVAWSEPEDLELDRALDWQRGRGLPFEVISAGEARELEPSLSAAARAAFSFPLDGQVAPERLALALSLAVRRAGAFLLERAQAVAVKVESRRAVGVETVLGFLRADSVVLSAGGAGALLPGCPELPLVSFGQELAVLDASEDPGRLSRFALAAGISLTPRRDGTVVAVSGPGPGGPLHDRPRAAPVAALLDRAVRLTPAAASYPVLAVGAALRTATPDGLPLLGETSTPGLWVAAGWGADGSLLAPAVSVLVADLLTGQTPALPDGPFSPRRFG